MKTMLCLTLTLLTFVTFTFVPNSFAQDDSPEYVVRVIYFIPNDRQPDPDIDTKLDTLVKDAQKFYADEMARHGFGRKTFTFEADTTGKVVHHVEGKFNNAHYQNAHYQRDDFTGKIKKEIGAYFDTSKNICLIFIELDIKGFCGIGAGRFAFINVRGCRVLNVVAHELGHTFGLDHDWRDDIYI